MTGKCSEKNLNIALLLLRLMVGIVFMFHGSQKLFGLFEGPGIEGFAGALEKMGFPFPVVNAWLAGLAEFVGGLALITGLGFRLLLIPLIFTMLVASFKVHGGAFSIQKSGMEYSLTLAVVMISLFLTGPGKFALGCGCLSKSCETEPKDS